MKEQKSRAFIFPGQGSQYVGMGKELAQTFAEARDVFREVDDVLNQHLSRIIFDGTKEELRLTENAQPALMAVSMAVIRVLERQGNIRVQDNAAGVAGHSLGEYTALCAAGSVSLRDVALLLRTRGRAMQQAVPATEGSMAALIGVEIDVADEIANAAAQGQVCTSANDNAPGQIVISGHIAAIERALAIAAERGFRRSVRLQVSAPFHCSLMAPAAAIMEDALAKTTFSAPCVPLIANVTAAPETNPDTLRELLVKQVTGRVRWRESIIAMREYGVSEFVECGAGNVLSGLTKRIDRSLTFCSLEKPAEIEKFLAG